MQSPWRALSVAAAVLGALCAGAAAQPQMVRVSAVPSKETVNPGDQIAVAVILDHEEGWHTHTNDPKVPPEWGNFPAIATEMTASGTGVKFGPIQWPKGHAIEIDLSGKGIAKPYEVFEGRAVAFVPVVIDAGAKPGALELTVSVVYQACDDRSCLPKQEESAAVKLTVAAPGTSAGVTGPADLFAGFDASVFGRMASGAPPPRAALTFGFFGKQVTIQTGGATGMLLLLSIAAAGGLLLNLTPCVLPVIPIKILGLSQVAGSRWACFGQGVVMSLGTMAFWIEIGAGIAFISGFKAINQLFQFPAFSIGVGVFIGLMGLGMWGLFTLSLPQKVYQFAPTHDSVVGSFLFGVMTAVLSTPCTAPLMGSAAAWATKQPPAVTLATFSAIGFGMALPYLVLSAFPVLLKWVPRTGPASELVKQVMGILLLAVAAFFIGTGLDPLLRKPIDPPIRIHWWVTFALVAWAAAWLACRTWRITRSPARRLSWTLVGVVMAGAMLMVSLHMTDRGPIDWIAYTPERLAERRAKGEVVVIDFTAEWCLNCKALEAAVLHRPEIVALLSTPGIVPMRVDLTGNNVPGNELLRSQDWVGIPLLAIEGPGLTSPLKYDTYTVDTVKTAIEKARVKR